MCLIFVCEPLCLTERQRINSLSWSAPLHRAYKTVEDEDLKFPLIYGEGKKVRVCVDSEPCASALEFITAEKNLALTLSV